MCNAKPDGTVLSTGKRAWYEGRGIWVYSFLYNKIDPDPKYLEVATKSVDFILRHRPAGDEFWTGSFTKEGAPAEGSGPGDIYGSPFIANGLTEYSKAEGKEQYWDIAKDIFLGCIRRYDSADYRYNVTYGPKAEHIQPPRVLGHWMVILRLATQMLDNRSDRDIEAIAARSVDAIMNHHYNPAYGLRNEVLQHDLSRADSPFDQFSYTGHAIETLWMVLYEAARTGDRGLWDDAVAKFRRHVEVSWDDVYGGAFRCLVHVDNNEWMTDKVLWLQEEVLIGTLFMIEHTGDQWAKDWFTKMYAYVLDKFPQKQYGYPLWIIGADRKVTFNPNSARIGNFHHPRHLMLNLLSIEQMRQRGGRISNLFG
jgi:mannose/cellobiose epimerase-like protein (N-acyl-D-glucosamine 2-epimerase family)